MMMMMMMIIIITREALSRAQVSLPGRDLQGLHSMDDFQIVMKTSLSQYTSVVKFSWRYDQQFSSGTWRRSVLYGWVQKCVGDFLVPWCISGKIFMKMWSVVIKILVILPLNDGGGLCSTDNFQNLIDWSLYHLWHFQKISSKSVHNLLRKVVDKQTNAIKNSISLRRWWW